MNDDLWWMREMEMADFYRTMLGRVANNPAYYVLERENYGVIAEQVWAMDQGLA